MAEHKSLFADFKEFLLRGNVVDLAVAVVIGTAFTALVKSFTQDLLTPIISIFTKHTNFQDLAVNIRGARFAYGDFINAVITFVILAAVVFFLVVKPINYLMERRRRSVEAGTEEPTSEDIALLTQIRDLLAATRGPAS
jgi:large conductance mechanosensitive channel